MFISSKPSPNSQEERTKLKAKNVVDHATKFKDEILPIADQIRDAVDFLERYCADDYWPLPIYREMLFVK